MNLEVSAIAKVAIGVFLAMLTDDGSAGMPSIAVQAIDSHSEAGFVTVLLVDGETISFAIDGTDPAVAEALFLAIAAGRGRLDVARH